MDFKVSLVIDVLASGEGKMSGRGTFSLKGLGPYVLPGTLAHLPVERIKSNGHPEGIVV